MDLMTQEELEECAAILEASDNPSLIDRQRMAKLTGYRIEGPWHHTKEELQVPRFQQFITWCKENGRGKSPCEKGPQPIYTDLTLPTGEHLTLQYSPYSKRVTVLLQMPMRGSERPRATLLYNETLDIDAEWTRAISGGIVDAERK